MIEHGITFIEDDVYFSDKSQLTRRDILNLCFKPYLYFLGEKKSDTKSMEMGRAFDLACTLNREQFNERIKMKEKRGEKSDDVVLLTEKEYETISGMYESFNNAGFVNMFSNWDSQAVISDGFRKGKLDFLSKDRKYIVDIKTIDSIESIHKHLEDYHYYFQEWWYKSIMESLGYEIERFSFYFIEKTYPYRIELVELDEYDEYSEYIYEKAMYNLNKKADLINLVSAKRYEPSKWLRRSYE